MAFVEAALISIPAVIVAPWLAAAGLHILNWVGPLADIGLHLDPKVSVSAYALAAAAGAVCIAGLTLPALRARGVVIARDRRRLDVAGLAQRMRLDLILVALALIGYWQLRRYHGVLVDNRGLGDRPVPGRRTRGTPARRCAALAAAGAARCLTRRAADRRDEGRRRRAGLPPGRPPAARLLPLDPAACACGRDRRLRRNLQRDVAPLAGRPGRLRRRRRRARRSERAGRRAADDRPRLSYRALGATAALPAVADSFDFAAAGGATGNLLALDAARAPGIVEPRGDFSSNSFAELMRPLAVGAAGWPPSLCPAARRASRSRSG